MPALCIWVLQHKRINAAPVSFRAFLLYITVFCKSNSASGHLKNVWGHSILLIKILQRHSLKQLQKVIVVGGKQAVSKVRKIPLLSNTTKRRCLHISEDLLNQLLDKLKKAQLFGDLARWNNRCFRRGSVDFVWYCRFANQETKTLSSCAVLTLEFAKLLKPSSPNCISSWKILFWLDEV